MSLTMSPRGSAADRGGGFGGGIGRFGDFDDVVGSGCGEGDHGGAAVEEADAGCGAAGEVDDADVFVGLPVCDGDDDAGAGVLHGDADAAAEG